MIKLWQIIDMIRDERLRIEHDKFRGQHDRFDHRVLIGMLEGAQRAIDEYQSEQKRRSTGR